MPCPESSLPAACLPQDLLIAILQRATRRQQVQWQLAQLVQLALVCREWQMAASIVATHLEDVKELRCHTLTPALIGWTADWDHFRLVLDRRGVPPAMEACMRSSVALASLCLECTGTADEGDHLALAHALEQAPALHSLYSLSALMVYPRCLRQLSFGGHNRVETGCAGRPVHKAAGVATPDKPPHSVGQLRCSSVCREPCSCPASQLDVFAPVP